MYVYCHESTLQSCKYAYHSALFASSCSKSKLQPKDQIITSFFPMSSFFFFNSYNVPPDNINFVLCFLQGTCQIIFLEFITEINDVSLPVATIQFIDQNVCFYDHFFLNRVFRLHAQMGSLIKMNFAVCLSAYNLLFLNYN